MLLSHTTDIWNYGHKKEISFAPKTGFSKLVFLFTVKVPNLEHPEHLIK